MDEWVWSNGGMILTREIWSTGRKTLYSVGGRWMNVYGAVIEWYWQGKTEVLGEKHYTASVVVGWMGMEQWWNDTDRRKLKYWEENLSQCQCQCFLSDGPGCDAWTMKQSEFDQCLKCIYWVVFDFFHECLPILDERVFSFVHRVRCPLW